MAEQALPDDFREFLRLLNEADVQYLLIGGYAVGYHGYPRATADMDLWVAVSPLNAQKLVAVFQRFGMRDSKLTPALFQEKGKIVRMGVPPMRIEVLTEIDGVTFEECYDARITDEIDGQVVHLISRDHLIRNKSASGRHKDLFVSRSDTEGQVIVGWYDKATWQLNISICAQHGDERTTTTAGDEPPATTTARQGEP